MTPGYILTDADRVILLAWFGIDTHPCTTTLSWDGTVWTAAWHTIGEPMGHGSEGEADTLHGAIQAMIDAM